MYDGMTVYIVVKREMHDESNYSETIYQGFNKDDAELHMYAEAAKLSIEINMPVTDEYGNGLEVGMYYFRILTKKLKWV